MAVLSMNSRIALALCGLAVIVEAGLMLAGSDISTLGLADTPIVLFVIGPYVALGLIAWWQRERWFASLAILGAIGVLMAWGLSVSTIDCFRDHTDPEYRLMQRSALFLVPLMQWIAVGLLGLALGVLRLWPDRKSCELRVESQNSRIRNFSDSQLSTLAGHRAPRRSVRRDFHDLTKMGDFK